ncbi:hypothetical protein CCACVL1_01093, partial [Corchorus capsularis]
TDKERHWKRAKTTKVHSFCDVEELFDGIPNCSKVSENLDQLLQSQRLTIDMFGDISPDHSEASPHPKALPLSAPEFTRFSADKVIEDGQLQLALILWESIQLKIARTPFDQVHLLVDEVRKIFAAIEGIKAVVLLH